MKWFRLPTFLSWCVLVLAPWDFARCPAAQDPRLAAAIPSIQESIRKSGADVGVAFRTLDGGAEWLFRADEAFHVGTLPRGSRRRQNFLDPHGFHILSKLSAEDPVAVPK